jgi:hypothetical protein
LQRVTTRVCRRSIRPAAGNPAGGPAYRKAQDMAGRLPEVARLFSAEGRVQLLFDIIILD